jgi:hypothetical protein
LKLLKIITNIKMKTKYILMSLFLILGITLMSYAAAEAVNLAPMIISDGIQGLSSQNLQDLIIPGGTGLAINFGLVAMPDKAGYTDGVENMGGFGIVAYLALYDDIASWPTEVDDPTSLEKLVELEGDFEMVLNKYFLKVLVSPNSMDLNPEGQGEPGGRSFNPKGTFMLPTFSPVNRGLARRLNNSRGVLIIPDDTGDFRHCLGSETRPVFFKASGTSGKNAADPKGFNFEFVCNSFAPTYTYNGTIALSGETLPVIS